MTFCPFIPDHVLAHLEDHDQDLAPALRTQRELSAALRRGRVDGEPLGPPIPEHDARTVLYDARHGTSLPGRKIAPGDDPAGTEAVDGLDAVSDLLNQYGISVDDTPMVATIHYDRGYDNAYWDGRQMVFGDGDGRYFGPFTRPLDVCGHERMHGVTGDSLDYVGQAGALNESMSDVVGVVSRQARGGEDINQPDSWLVGRGLLLESGARGLRDMLNPGTAYDTAGLGPDPQPADMAHYIDTRDDDGGVHLNSGIPNRAFALAARAHGNTIDVLRVWLSALQANTNPRVDFAGWAALTVAHAPAELQQAVRDAWTTVGVLQAEPAPQPVPTPGGDTGGGTGGGADPFRAALEAFPGLADRVDELATERHMTPVDFAAWRLAGLYHKR